MAYVDKWRPSPTPKPLGGLSSLALFLQAVECMPDTLASSMLACGGEAVVVAGKQVAVVVEAAAGAEGDGGAWTWCSARWYTERKVVGGGGGRRVGACLVH